MKKYLTFAIAIGGITIGLFYLQVNNQLADKKIPMHASTEKPIEAEHHATKAIFHTNIGIPNAAADGPVIISKPEIENNIIDEKKN